MYKDQGQGQALILSIQASDRTTTTNRDVFKAITASMSPSSIIERVYKQMGRSASGLYGERASQMRLIERTRQFWSAGKGTGPQILA